MLLGAAAIWGGSFVVLKGALDVVPAPWLLGIRFVLAGIVLGLVFARRIAAQLNKGHVLSGLALGVTGGIAYLVQNTGLAETTPGHNAFLTATYCVMVPFLHWAAAQSRPQPMHLVAACMALTGVGILSLEGGSLSLNRGDVLTLISAFWFAVQIEVMVAVAPGHDVLTCTVIEFFAMGLICLFYGIVAVPPPPPSAFVGEQFWFQMCYLVLLASCVCIVAQNVGQANVPPAQASLLMSLESVFGVAFSVLIYGDPLTPQLIFGFVLVFAAVLISELRP